MDRSELAPLGGDADVPSGSDESVEVESAGIRELPNPDRPIM